jgi:predicted DCC family thiol-disulfide oxidoreductase YuxK
LRCADDKDKALVPLTQGRTTVLYDGGCSLCRREIQHYRRLDGAERVEWMDITRNDSLLRSLGIPFETAMERLHVLQRDGKVATGVHAFAVIWDELPRYQALARLVRSLRLLPVLERLYSRFARWRFRQRCAEGACRLPAGVATGDRRHDS